MFSLETPAGQSPAGTKPLADVAERAERELRRNAYVALKNIACEHRDGVLTLTGCLPTYYLKQVAQEAVTRVDGVERVDNRIDVVSVPSRGSSCT
jgi:osmotically-inducible protein OsmY